jgi:Rap1a immunity proteins
MLAMRHAPYHPLLFILLGTVNAAPAPKAPSLNIRTAEDLAVACAARPTTPSNAAMLNFCNGFAQGVVRAESQNPGGSKTCIPKPAPKRSETMAEYAKWVSADAARKTDVAMQRSKLRVDTRKWLLSQAGARVRRSCAAPAVGR